MALSVKNMLGGSGGGASPFAWGKYEIHKDYAVETRNKTYYISNTTSGSITYYDASSFTVSNGVFRLNSPTEHTIGLNSYDTIPSQNFFIVGDSVGEIMFRGSSVNLDTRLLNNTSAGIAVSFTASGNTFDLYTLKNNYNFLEYVTDKNPLKYPNGEIADDGFFYRYANEGLYIWNKSTIHEEFEADMLKLQDDLPYVLYQGNAVEFDGELHILGGSAKPKGHYKWNGASWIDLGGLPYNFYYGGAVVYNNEIHIIGGNGYVTLHYKWDGSSWTNVGVLPYSFSRGGCVVYHNKIHILGSVVNGQLSDGTYYYSCHYSFDGSTWTREADVCDFFYDGGCVVYNDEIHLLGNYGSPRYDYHYKWDGSSWTTLNNMPYHFRQGQAVVYENKIHILGSYDYGTEHRVWDEVSDSWIERTKKLPNNYCEGCAIALSDGLHILGTNASTSSKKTHYIVDGYKTVYVPFDIVISDNENAYPSDREMDGYYYKKTSAGLVPEMFGCSKIAVDKFIPTTNATMSGFSISHSLGEIPKAVIIADTTSWDDYYASRNRYTIKLAFIPNFAGITSPNSGASSIAWFYYSSGDKVDYTYATGSWEMTSSTVKATSSTGFGTSAGYMSKHEYTVITMA